MLKKIIVSLLLLATVLCFTVPADACWVVIDRRIIRPGVVHEFVDRDCNGTIDIVQEYRLIGGVWQPTVWWLY